MNVFIIRTIFMFMNCIKCGNELKGRQKKFCSRICKNRHSNSWSQTAEKQKEKGTERKQVLVEYKGGKCIVCSYNKCLRSLSFHHRIPSEKSFSLDLRNLTNRNWNSILKEVEKCDLLCMNCHMEVEDGGPSRI